MNQQITNLTSRIKESLSSVLPVSLIVLALCFTCTGVESGVFLSFIIGTFMLIVGMGLFNIGVDTSMNSMGEFVGAQVTKTRNIPKIVLVSFLVGAMITASEPDLGVLADKIPAIDKLPIVIAVSVGTGLFLVIAMLRIVYGVKLKYLLLASYAAVFILAAFVPTDFWAIAFDAGGVTTGPMTVPFILALGVGVSSIRSDKSEESDSFGLVALCSVGPIISVLILGLLYSANGGGGADVTTFEWTRVTTDLSLHYLTSLPGYMLEVLISVAPIFAFFVIFQFLTKPMKPSQLLKIAIGAFVTMIGLVIFLTGANVGFMPLGQMIGTNMMKNDVTRYLTVPIGMIIGFFIVRAEPAVHILTKQISNITSGAISESAMLNTLCISVSASVGLSFVRMLLDIPFIYFIIPGYAAALILTFFSPDIFASIAFDSGGVASGPMASTFLLSMAIGMCESNVTAAFGTVAMVAMTPLIAIQIFGIVYKVRAARAERVIPEIGRETVIDL